MQEQRAQQGAGAETEVVCVLINGDKHKVSLREVAGVITDRAAVGYFLICFFIVGYLHPSATYAALLWWEKVLSISAMGFVFLVLILLGIMLVYAANRWLLRLPVIVPLHAAMSMVVMELIAREFNFCLFAVPRLTGPDFLRGLVTNYIYVASFELLYTLFVLPRTAVWLARYPSGPVLVREEGAWRGQPVWQEPPHPARTAERTGAAVPEVSAPEAAPEAVPEAPAEPPPPPEPAHIILGALKVPVDTVLGLKAEDHYINLLLSDRDHFVRHRFADAVLTLPEELGMQVHRSWWVALHAVTRVTKLPDGRMVLELGKRHRAPVSRRHRRAVEEALARRRAT